MIENQTKAIEGILKFLKICGLWPNYKRYYVPYMVYAIIFQTIFTFIYIGFQLVNFYFLTEINVITKALFICLSEVALFVKVFNFAIYNKELQQMLIDVKEFKLMNAVEMKLYQKQQLLFTRIVNFQLLMARFAIFFSCVSPFFSSEPALPYKFNGIIVNETYV